MKKITAVVLTVFIALGAAACTSGTAMKAIEEGRQAIQNGEYTQAISYFRIAQNEGSEDKEVADLISILEGYINAKGEFDKKNIDAAVNWIDHIPDTYGSYSIAVDIDKLKKEINDFKDEGAAAQQEVSSTPAPTATPAQNSGNDYSSIISSRSDSEIESYITSYVRPLYNEVNSNLNSYTKSSVGNATLWNDGKGVIRKTFGKGTNGSNLAREYYYDTDSGRIAFAFLYDGGTEYRLYFRTNQLVRYIGPDGVTVNNPTSDEALRMASFVLSEAY